MSLHGKAQFEHDTFSQESTILIRQLGVAICDGQQLFNTKRKLRLSSENVLMRPLVHKSSMKF